MFVERATIGRCAGAAKRGSPKKNYADWSIEISCKPIQPDEAAARWACLWVTGNDNPDTLASGPWTRDWQRCTS